MSTFATPNKSLQETSTTSEKPLQETTTTSEKPLQEVTTTSEQFVTEKGHEDAETFGTTGSNSPGSQTRSFQSPDSLSPFGSSGLNPYSYCANDPINMLDHNGQ
ncbi:hypothetical protein BGZ68_010689 [Mortierella alpina]|nr:hypothetical protein BGZ68_010689 [Mortierella alpina]